MVELEVEVVYDRSGSGGMTWTHVQTDNRHTSHRYVPLETVGPLRAVNHTRCYGQLNSVGFSTTRGATLKMEHGTKRFIVIEVLDVLGNEGRRKTWRLHSATLGSTSTIALGVPETLNGKSTQATTRVLLDQPCPVEVFLLSLGLWENCRETSQGFSENRKQRKPSILCFLFFLLCCY